jgi:hypothetical protein
MPRLHEIDAVEILVDRPAQGLSAGDTGTVVLVHGDGEAVEVEFLRGDGETWILDTFRADEVRVAWSNAAPGAAS